MNEYNWKNRITRFLTAQTISLFGSSLVQYAIIWHITLTTSSGKMLTISTLCGFLPQILISLFAGVLIDRYNRKKLIMLTDSLIAVSTLILAVVFINGVDDLWLFFVVLALRSAGAGIQTPAVNAIIPQMVPQEKLMKINGINSTLSSMIMFLSPAVSGMLLSIASLEVTLFIDVITALIGVGITFTIKIKPLMRSDAQLGSRLNDIKQGFLYLKSNKLIKSLLVFQLIILFLISSSAFLPPLLVSRTFGPEVWRLTASEMAYSLGMILGGILITWWGGFKKHLNTTLLASGIYGMLMVGIGLAPIFYLYLTANALIGITSPCYNTPITVTIQKNVPSAMQGRVFSMMQIATSSALPLGMVVFGPLADTFPVQNLLIFAGVLVIIVTVITGDSLRKS